MPKYAEGILAAVTELQQHPTAEQVFLAVFQQTDSCRRKWMPLFYPFLK